MEKGPGKYHFNRIWLLVSLSGLFWILLLYFHFVVLGHGVFDFHDAMDLESRFSNRKSKFPPVLDEDKASKVSQNTTGGNHSSVTDSVSRVNEQKQAPIILRGGDTNLATDSFNQTMKQKEVESQNSRTDGGRIVGQNSSGSDSFKKVNGQNNSFTGRVGLGGQNPSIDTAKKVVEQKENYPFMRALRTSDNKSDPCGGRYIYVHDLPCRFNKDMLKQCRTLSIWTNMCKYMSNAGLGPPLENKEGVFPKTGWYATNQFAVDVIFNNRMSQYECLTKDSSIAAAVFVPFYAGFDVARYLWGYNTSMRDAASLDLLDWLTKRPEWKVMEGRDHFLVAGRITWDFRRTSEKDSDWGSKLLFLPAARNMSMLVVESSPWSGNDFGIPYPTYFHPTKDSEVFMWQNRMRQLERKWLLSFAGAPRPGNSKSIRGQIIDQCKASQACKLLECDFGESKCHSPSSIMQMFQSSMFCLQPQGDSYTRRSAFDSMVAGCIPVFFHPGSAYIQYTWHLPRNYTSYSVFIPEDDVRKNISIQERLAQFSPEQINAMRETVISLIPRLLYADPRSKLETLKDAFDVSIEAIIDKVTSLRKNIILGRTEYHDFVEETSWKFALLEKGQREVGPHEWDSFFSKPKGADNNEQRDHKS